MNYELKYFFFKYLFIVNHKSNYFDFPINNETDNFDTHLRDQEYYNYF